MALISTKNGDVEESLLHKVVSVTENDNEIITLTNYYCDGIFVRNDVHVHLKKGLSVFAEASTF